MFQNNFCFDTYDIASINEIGKDGMSVEVTPPQTSHRRAITHVVDSAKEMI